ncbi:PDZ domain-containing protein [Rapidithrix thailandica]|uniref:PDZ domain-containing protein n=1 Tax=Rapidithrix thailandica TaxID=413964 RepID=A0AAW9S2W4_9BACT
MKILYAWALVASMLCIGCTSSSDRVLTVVPEGQTNSHPDSFHQLEKALQAARELRREAPAQEIEIQIAAGEYYLGQTLEIGPELSGIRLTTKDKGQVVVKGAKRLEARWEPFEGGLWKAKVNTSQGFDQLVINGEVQVLARYPNIDAQQNHWNGSAADAIAPERIKHWKQPQGGILHVLHGAEWGGFHYQITGLDEKGAPVLAGGHQNNRPWNLHKNYRMVENIREELDSPGEWYFDQEEKTVYFWPPEGLDLTSAKTEVSHLKQLINIKGSRDNPVKGVSISGIVFEQSQRTLFEKYEPLLRSDWMVYRGGAITLSGAENCSIEQNTFRNLGGNVIFVDGYNRDIRIVGNHIYQCGATAIAFVGDPSAVRSPSFQYKEFVPWEEMDTLKGPKNTLYPENCLAENNLIHDIGTIEKQVAGVQISMAAKISVIHNSIYDIPRAGINISEGTWGGHDIAYNDVFNTVLETGDHGAFNSWGRDRFWHPNRKVMDSLVARHPGMPAWDAIYTTTIRNNRFRCDHGWDIDLDDGSSNYHIYNNLCLSGGLKLREGFHRVVENNILVNNGFHPHVWFKQSNDIFRANIVMTSHQDIALQAWGKEVDYNFFTSENALKLSQKGTVGQHSQAGDPKFVAASQGDFRVGEQSSALEVGFQNFSMDSFGVQLPLLKKMAKSPAIPQLFFELEEKTSVQAEWLGATLKNVETLAERSAAGLSGENGVLILAIEEGSLMATAGLQKGDVLLGLDGKEVNNMAELLNQFQGNKWKEHLQVKYYRNQQTATTDLKLK